MIRLLTLGGTKEVERIRVFFFFFWIFIYLDCAVLVETRRIFLVAACKLFSSGIWELVTWLGGSNPSRCIGNAESQPLDHQGSLRSWKNYWCIAETADLIDQKSAWWPVSSAQLKVHLNLTCVWSAFEAPGRWLWILWFSGLIARPAQLQ